MEYIAIHTPTDYKVALNDVMDLEAYGILNYSAYHHIDIVAQLLQAYEIIHNPTHWCKIRNSPLGAER